MRSEAMRLAHIYFDQEKQEFENVKQHFERNNMSLEEQFWPDVERTFATWLRGLHDNPAQSLATSNWRGKVTRAYFKLKGLPIPRTKHEMVAIVTKGEL